MVFEAGSDLFVERKEYNCELIRRGEGPDRASE
jgi:hypothetical protein